jgi:hypothetical protein
MIVTILGNLSCMLIDSHPFNRDYSVLIEKLNFVFEVLYLSELTIKLIAFGFKDYVHQHSMNIYDSLIVVASLVDICLVLIMNKSGEKETRLENQSRMENSIFITVLRAFRIMRIFKLARYWRSFYILLETLWITILNISTFARLLTLVLFIYTMIGLELFAH